MPHITARYPIRSDGLASWFGFKVGALGIPILHAVGYINMKLPDTSIGSRDG